MKIKICYNPYYPLGCPRIGFFFRKSVDPLNTGMCYGIRSPQNDFQNYRPITPILQALFVFNGNFNGKMAQF